MLHLWFAAVLHVARPPLLYRELPCDGGLSGYCAVLAEGALAPELANISSLVALDFSGQQLSGKSSSRASGAQRRQHKWDSCWSRWQPPKQCRLHTIITPASTC